MGSGGSATGSGGAGGSGGGTGSGGAPGTGGRGSGGSTGSGGSAADGGVDRPADAPAGMDAPQEMRVDMAPDRGPGSAMYRQVQTLLNMRCTPCHIEEVTSELSLKDVRTQVNVNSVDCTTKARIKPGDPMNSYIVDKLRGRSQVANGCYLGERMPDFMPALPENEISLISAWIQAGAM